MNEYTLSCQLIHNFKKVFEIGKAGALPDDGYVDVMHAEGFDETSLLG